MPGNVADWETGDFPVSLGAMALSIVISEALFCLPTYKNTFHKMAAKLLYKSMPFKATYTEAVEA